MWDAKTFEDFLQAGVAGRIEGVFEVQIHPNEFVIPLHSLFQQPSFFLDHQLYRAGVSESMLGRFHDGIFLGEASKSAGDNDAYKLVDGIAEQIRRHADEIKCPQTSSKGC